MKWAKDCRLEEGSGRGRRLRVVVGFFLADGWTRGEAPLIYLLLRFFRGCFILFYVVFY
jgi:hypothetical protein